MQFYPNISKSIVKLCHIGGLHLTKEVQFEFLKEMQRMSIEEVEQLEKSLIGFQHFVPFHHNATVKQFVKKICELQIAQVQ
jgi:hypothetical protein